MGPVRYLNSGNDVSCPLVCIRITKRSFTPTHCWAPSPRTSDLVGLGWRPNICIFNKFSSDATEDHTWNAAVLGTLYICSQLGRNLRSRQKQRDKKMFLLGLILRLREVIQHSSDSYSSSNSPLKHNKVDFYQSHLLEKCCILKMEMNWSEFYFKSLMEHYRGVTITN